MCYVIILRRVIMLRRIYEVILRRIHSTGCDVAYTLRRIEVMSRRITKVCYVVMSRRIFMLRRVYEV